jgi:hypothetical protein
MSGDRLCVQLRISCCGRCSEASHSFGDANATCPIVGNRGPLNDLTSANNLGSGKRCPPSPSPIQV